MEITCPSCQSKFKISDDKIPEGRTASFACPKCEKKITVESPTSEKTPADGGADGVAAEFGFDEDFEESADKPFDFIEEEGKIALVCESDTTINEKIVHALELLEYHVSEAKDSRDALKNLRYKPYDVVVVNEFFGTKDPDKNGVLIYIERLHMDIRRNMFVALVTDRYRTMDYMRAFAKSVNLIINKQNMSDVDKIMAHNIAEHEMFYRIYKEESH